MTLAIKCDGAIRYLLDENHKNLDNTLNVEPLENGIITFRNTIGAAE